LRTSAQLLLELLYGEMPRELSPDAALFCLFSEPAARVAIRAHAAATWGEFAHAVDLPFNELVDPNGDWGEEIAEAVGRRPEPGDSFRLADYWGNWCFAGIVIPPCQAAVLAIFDRPEINRLLTDVGFEYANGAPGSDGDAFVFRHRSLILRLEQEIARRHTKAAQAKEPAPLPSDSQKPSRTAQVRLAASAGKGGPRVLASHSKSQRPLSSVRQHQARAAPCPRTIGALRCTRRKSPSTRALKREKPPEPRNDGVSGALASHTTVRETRVCRDSARLA
jgi:hypothetical protein